MTDHGTIRALAASLRLPNLPSVLSNSLTGMILATMITNHEAWDHGPAWLTLSLIWLAATCLYFSGNLFNDWADQSWDRLHRPERALPSGRFKARQYLIAGISLTAVAWTCAALTSFAALLVSGSISLFIILYTWMHKRSVWSVIPMALCRALLPILGYVAFSTEMDPPDLIPALLLFCYLIMLTLRARSETTGPGNPYHQLSSIGFLLPPAIATAVLIGPYGNWQIVVIATSCTIPYLLWTSLALTRYRQPVSRQVSALLAGIPLVDGLLMLYLLFALPKHPTILLLTLLWLPAFLAGRLLQRFVPAT